MAQKYKEVQSRAGDAVLLAALFIPFAPIVTTFYLYMARLALGCPADSAQGCSFAGIDFNFLTARSAELLEWTARAGAGGLLLIYMLLLAGVAQFTTKGLRGRVVRTCAVIMWAGVLPLILGLAAAIARSPQGLCGGAPCNTGHLFASFALFGNVFFLWLANIAVPLAVLAAGLVALTLGYRALIGRVVQLATRRN